MEFISANKAQENLDNLLAQVGENHTPVLIKGEQNEAILISKEDWEAIEETIYLNSIPGYVNSIQEIIASSRDEWVDAQDLGL